MFIRSNRILYEKLERQYHRVLVRSSGGRGPRPNVTFCRSSP